MKDRGDTLPMVPNAQHFQLLKSGVEKWNGWRKANPTLRPNLNAAYLLGESIIQADLSNCDMVAAKMTGCQLYGSDFSGSDLRGVKFDGANLRETKLRGANLTGADMTDAILNQSDLSSANLSGALLIRAVLVDSDLRNADISGCAVYGASAWDVRLDGAIQHDLIITMLPWQPVTVDNLEVAQFIYLLLNNQKIRHIIDTITSKVVLILGRFTPERKAILDAIRDELRKRDYLPVLFDFEKPANRDITETVSTLAHMARFVIADITDARSIPQELMRIVPALPSVPVQPLLLASQREYGMFEHFRRFPWVLEPFLYHDQDQLLGSLDSHVVGPAEAKAKEQTRR